MALYSSLHTYPQSIFKLTIQKILYLDSLFIMISGGGSLDQLGKMLDVAGSSTNM